MIPHGIDVPRFDKFTKHEVVDSTSLLFNSRFREFGDCAGCPLDVDRLLDWLEISTEWDAFDEEDSVACFARIDLTINDLIQVNLNYKDLFESRPDVYRVCICHELGHIILGHISHFPTSNNLSLFDDVEKDQKFLHKNSWAQYGLSSDEVRRRQLALKQVQAKLVRNAIISPIANQALRHIDDKFEPEWMFWQAEHFARCISIPRDKLLDSLQSMSLDSGWSSIGKLANIFEVPLGAMKTRLLKLNIIRIDENGVPQPVLNEPMTGKNLF